MVRTLTSIFQHLLKFADGITEFLSRQISGKLPIVGSFSFSVVEFLFGAGVYVILSYWLVKYLLP